MKIIKNEVRPVGYCILELTVEEAQCLINLFEDFQEILNRPFTEIGGIRGDIYKSLCEIVNIKQNNT